MRAAPSAIRRVILVVLDGLRPDAIDAFGLEHLQRLMARGAWTRTATTVSPSVTAAAMGSLVSGAPPAVHGLRSDRFHLPIPTGRVDPLPRVLADHGLPSSAFVRELPLLFRPLGGRIARMAGVGDARFAGTDAPSILLGARGTLRARRPGLVLLHWPDTDRAGHAHGWMSREYGEAARRMDASLGLLVALAELWSDPSTLLVAMADHGGGGAVPDDHDSAHPLDRTIPICLAGAAVRTGELAPHASLLDVPATVCWALGVPIPGSYAGRVLLEAFGHPATAAA